VHNKAKRKVVNNTQVGVSTQAQTKSSKGPYEPEEVKVLNVDNSWDWIKT
jgi:hypothetical protein